MDWDYPQNANSTGYWYWDDEDEIWDEDEWSNEEGGRNRSDREASEEDILRYASASPTNEIIEEISTPIKVITFKPSRLEKPLCDSITHQIFEEQGVAQFAAYPLAVWEVDWKILDGEDLELSEEYEEYKYEPPHVSRVQKALIEVFEHMRRFKRYNEERLLEEVRDSLLPELKHDFSDWERRSTGVSLFIHQDIGYEGGAEMPNDGFSIQSEGRIFHPFDKE